MAGMTHLGVGMAAKHFAPKMPLWVLIVGAYVLDILWGIFFLVGVEYYPTSGVARTAPWSHGLLMAVIWSAAAVLIFRFISRDLRSSLFFGGLVFSHWLVDFIAKPMLYSFPTDSGLPLFFDGSPTVGLGVWGTELGQNLGEYGMVILGLILYIFTLVRLKREKKLNPSFPTK